MNFTDGAHVYTANGKKLGNLERVVFDPRSKQVTDIVIGKGLLLSEDKVIPAKLIDSVKGDQVQLKAYDASWNDFPTYDERYYIVHNEQAMMKDEQIGPQPTMLMYYPPVTPMAGLLWPGGFASPYFAQAGRNPAFEEKTSPNIPQGTVALKEGSRVVTADNQNVGSVEKIIAQPDQRVTHLVISKGEIFGEEKLIPVIWIRDVVEDEVHLAVNANVLKNLPPFEG